ncbi:MAG: TolC family protein, partial [Bacteroidota bacterium]
QLTLHSAITKALQSNLGIRIQQSDVSLAGTEIDLAKADLLPQANVSTVVSASDELTTLSRQGAQGRANWLLNAELSQTVFAEPLLANVTIQKLLQKSEEQALLQTQLDVIIDVTSAYMNILFAKSNLNIQQQNVERNKENFDIAKAKEAIGYTGASDINRWEAELANANIELNNAFASLRQAKFQLNQLLNRPINEPVEIEDASLEASALLIADSRLDVIDNYGTLEKFSDFLVGYAMERLPELAQIDLGVKVQERLQLSRERAMYLPTVGLNATANRVLGRIDVPESLPGVEKATTWDVSLGVSYPIFQGNSRRKLIEQSKINLIQLEDNRKNVENQLELLIRANIETVGASYSRMELAQKAADASRKNYQIVQDAYSAGQTNITTLIDAQNNAQATELNSDNAVFTFILDFLNLERSIGYFNFLANTAERDAFFQDMQTYMNQN